MKLKIELAIKKDILNDGREVYTPVVRRKWGLISYGWQRIVCIYGVYCLLDLDFEPGLTYDECKTHLEGYHAELRRKIAGNVKESEFHELEVIDLTY